jgi:hypothetical protein
MDDFNPYAAPETPVSAFPVSNDTGEVRGVWRDGKTLVMAKIAELPNRCVKCNAPATTLLKRSLSWHNPLLYMMVFFPGLLFYIIVALIVRKTAKVYVPLCQEHRSQRSRNILIAWVVSLTGIALFFVAGAVDSYMLPAVVIAGIVLLLFGLIFGSMTSQVVTPKKIDDTHAWINKVGLAYLATLPPLPGTEENDPRFQASISKF